MQEKDLFLGRGGGNGVRTCAYACASAVHVRVRVHVPVHVHLRVHVPVRVLQMHVHVAVRVLQNHDSHFVTPTPKDPCTSSKNANVTLENTLFRHFGPEVNAECTGPELGSTCAGGKDDGSSN